MRIFTRCIVIAGFFALIPSHDAMARAVSGSEASRASLASMASLQSTPPTAARDVASEIGDDQIRRLREAAEQGDPQAQYDLGSRYYDGKGVAQDYEQAFEWYRKAAERGLARAQGFLGGAYFVGRGVAEDAAKALYWSGKAAEQGLAEAQYILGICYLHGAGVAKDHLQAANWLRKAAEQGLANAQGDLAAMYAAGHGVEADYVQAYKWFCISETFSSPADQVKIAGLRDSLGMKMTADQIAEAEKQAQAWTEAYRRRRQPKIEDN